MKKIVTLISITIIPICIFLIAFRFRSYFSLFHTTGVDPEYAFLFNGLNVALLKLKIWHIDHPGTPLQLFSGIIIHLTHLFRGEGKLISDVLSRPEVYLRAINFSLILMVAISNYFLGFFSYRHIQNIFLSYILQLTPFLSGITIGTLFRVALEPAIIITTTIYMTVLVQMLSNDYERKHIILLAIATGLSIATKINTAIIIIIPLFFLKNIRERLIYVGLSILSFFVLAFPVILQIRRYFFWIKKLITHSGNHGAGTNQIIDIEHFISNFKLLMTQNIIWSSILILLLVVVVLYYLPKINQLLFIANSKYRAILTGLLISYILLIIIVCKHYAYYYILPGLLLINFVLVLIILSIKNKFIRNFLAIRRL